MKGKKGKKSRSPSPKKVEGDVKHEPEVEGGLGLDGQMMTKSDANLFNPNQVLGAESETSLPPTNLYIPDDASSIIEEVGTEFVQKGVTLSEDLIAEGLSNPGYSSCGTMQVYLNITLAGYEMENVALLGKYVHLQKVSLSYNKLTDLSPLSSMKSMVELDVSHNDLKDLLNFDPPRSLRVANFSHNHIEILPDLSEHGYLTHLDVSHNNISTMQGLQNCGFLLHLNLSSNQISRIDGVGGLPLRHLLLANNNLLEISNLDENLELELLDLPGNKISVLSGLRGNAKLYSLNLSDNQITDLAEIQHIEAIRNLRKLKFTNNGICQLEDYRKSVIFAMQQLTELDGHRVTVEEKVAAVNLFDPPPEVQAALDHITHTVYRFLQPSKIYESTLPSIEMPYPMLVLTGPQASGKRELAHRLAQEFPDYFGFGISHTTRLPYPGEQDGKDYHFVAPEHFQALVRQGCFIQTFKHNGQLYGLTLDAVECVAKEGLACVVHMEINGIRTLKNTYFEPRYVLIIPVSLDEHRRRLVERGTYREEQIDYILNDQRANYKAINQRHPGFFDMVINSDKLAEAYDRLRQLVMDYLGTTDLTSGEADAVQPRLSTTEHKDETGTHQTSLSANMRRTWSRPSFHGDSGNGVNDATSARNKAKLESRKTPVEEASYRRRQNAAKEAVEGYSPSIYDELFGRPLVPMTAPGMLEGSPLAQAASLYQDPSFASSLYPNVSDNRINQAKALQNLDISDETKSQSSDSSSQSRAASSGLSGLSSARGFSDQESGKLAKTGSKSHDKAPTDIKEEPLDLTALSDALESLKGSLKDTSRTTTPLGPRLMQNDLDVWMDQSVSDRVGANTKPVLPPIPTGGR